MAQSTQDRRDKQTDVSFPMPKIKKEIVHARPRLKEIAPLTNYISWGYAITNIALGIGMMTLYDTSIPIAVASILSYFWWGTIFMGLGVFKAYALLTNRWMAVKNAHLFGLVLKSVWAIALVIRCFEAPQTIIIAIVWFFFAYIQAGVFIYFLPAIKAGANERLDNVK